jgi:hypothetical protein
MRQETDAGGRLRRDPLTSTTMCPDTSRGPASRCLYPGCDRSVWQDPDGSFSSFCGRAHRDAMRNLPDSQRPAGMCKVRRHGRLVISRMITEE